MSFPQPAPQPKASIPIVGADQRLSLPWALYFPTIDTAVRNLVTAFGTVGYVISYNGRTGAVVPATGDYSFSQISGTVSNTQLPSPIPTAANPASSVGLSVINGSATTFMRSDAAPALSQAIVPTWSGLHTFGAGLTSDAVITITPASGLNQALDITQTWSGTISGSTQPPNDINSLTITDSAAVNNIANFIQGLAMYHNFGGSSAVGGRISHQIHTTLTAPTSPSNIASAYYIGQEILVQANTGDNGTLGSEKGYLVAHNPIVNVVAGATHFVQAMASQLQVQVETGASVLDKWAMQISQLASDAVAGSRNDCAINFANYPGAIGWSTLLQIGDTSSADHPLATTGTILNLKSSPTIANGIDLSGAGSITGSAFKSPGFSVDGSGNVTPNSIVGTTTNNNAPAGSVGEYKSALLSGSAQTVTITIATPAVVTPTTEPSQFVAGYFTTTGALPTGLTANTNYWTSGTGTTFNVATSLANALASTFVATSGSQSGTQTFTNAAQLTTASTLAIACLQVPAGDWDIGGQTTFTQLTTATVQSLKGSISTTSGSLVGPSSGGSLTRQGFTSTGEAILNTDADLVMGDMRFSFASTTNVYLNVNATFSAGTVAAYGYMWARRVR